MIGVSTCRPWWRVVGVVLSLGIGAFLASAPAHAGVLVLDALDAPDPADFFVLTGGDSIDLIQQSPTIIGGEREFSAAAALPATVPTVAGLIGHLPIFDVNALQVQTQANGTRFDLLYDGIGPADAGLGSLEFITGIQLDFLSIDTPLSNGLDLDIELTSPGGTATFSTVLLQNPNPHSILVPLTDFTLGGAFDLADISSLLVVLNRSQIQDIDFELNRISAPLIPEPSSLCLYGGLILLCGYAGR